MSGLISGKLLLRQELETLTDGSDADALHAHPAIGGDVVYADNADAAYIDINSVTNTLIKTTDIANVAVGDSLQATLIFRTDNSGTPRSLLLTLDFDGAFANTTPGIGVSSTADEETLLICKWNLAVASTSYAQYDGSVWQPSGEDVGVWKDIINVGGDGLFVWDTTTSDLTGTITVSANVKLNALATTATLLVHSFVVRKISST